MELELEMLIDIMLIDTDLLRPAQSTNQSYKCHRSAN